MTTYLVRRLAAVPVLIFAVSVLVFLFIRMIPGDPVKAILGTNAGDPTLVDRLHRQLGLDKSLQEQYGKWLGGALHGDFGYSYIQQRSVGQLVMTNLNWTLQLVCASLVVSLILGTAVGTFAALKRNSGTDTLVMTTALVFLSIPSFWLGLLLLVAFAVQLHWFSVVGGGSLSGLVLPAATLGLGSMGFIARFVRSSIIETLEQPHVLYARARGIQAGAVIRRHVMRNSIAPLLTVIGLEAGNLVTGAVMVETIYSRPGLGRLLVYSSVNKDYLTVQAVVLLIALIYVLINLVIDLVRPVLDPRLAYVK
jgi:ABC-type dipeptide/oligopeptide/nickel transport system permease component